jgi:asparagine synthase (glutamine-hydrolysing)
MCDALVHRGPDDAGYVAEGPAALGMRRLSIIDLETGRQPMCNEDKCVWVVFNGEIYNYRELRSWLEGRGHRFTTASDTEVIVHAYEELGPECVGRLRGMFAFAVWDAASGRLVLARDRLGIKPLYYARLSQGLAFASELKALLVHPEVGRDIEPRAMVEYFRHLCVPGDLSIFRAVRKLLPAHVLVFDRGTIALRRYWSVQPDPRSDLGEAQWTEALQAKLQDAVASHLVADVPVGAFLSGGLDSGAMVALMARASGDPVRTFTVGFRMPAAGFDEREPARAVADRYATLHRECLLEADLTDVLPRVAGALDEPFADSGAIPTWLVCQETARHVKVVLSGLGGDELFGGYERYAGLLLGERFRRLPAPVRRAAAGLFPRLGLRAGGSPRHDRLRRFLLGADLPTRERYRSFITAFAPLEDALHPDVLSSAAGPASRYDQVMDQVSPQHPLDVALLADLHMYLPDDLLTLTDRVSMAHSLEVRVPFLDHELVELAARMPAGMKVSGLTKKRLFRRAVAPWLPAGHLRLPKQGFSVPMAQWLRGPLRGMLLDLVHGTPLGHSPWLNARAIRRMTAEHLDGSTSHEVRLWAVICFLEWQRQQEAALPVLA